MKYFIIKNTKRNKFFLGEELGLTKNKSEAYLYTDKQIDDIRVIPGLEFIPAVKYPRKYKRFNPNNWDWFSFLRMGEANKSKHWEQANKLASKWVTCACGQVCSVLRGKSIYPEDYKLYDLGMDFMNCIQNSLWDKAKLKLEAIEARTNFLLTCPDLTDPNAED